ncbi:hypothetical protein POM88_008668 [Heracleum sosnowskyi]|uniref:Uncharacterized protein n=1 Tax=Heracleum sosnowskyi TaxID=360622 RepID=A0AAD8N1Y0_9APIA|nr:hypothetical protein POM88_008668 [Heracleum sosnowskyi]
MSAGDNVGEADVLSVNSVCVLPLHAMLPASAQLLVFDEVADQELSTLLLSSVIIFLISHVLTFQRYPLTESSSHEIHGVLIRLLLFHFLLPLSSLLLMTQTIA